MEQKNEEIDNLKKQLATMYMDLQKKNSVLQELTSQRTVTIKARKSEINGNIMSHEAILNALSEDEYIVWCCYEKFNDLGFFMKKVHRFCYQNCLREKSHKYLPLMSMAFWLINLTFEYELKLVHSFYPRPIMFIPCFVILKANHDHYFIVQSNQLNILYFFHYMCFFYYGMYFFIESSNCLSILFKIGFSWRSGSICVVIKCYGEWRIPLAILETGSSDLYEVWSRNKLEIYSILGFFVQTYINYYIYVSASACIWNW